MTPRLSCPSRNDLHLAITAGADGALTAHLAACPRCAGQWRRLGLARDLAREIPTASPAPAELEQLRTRLLAAQHASRLPGARRPWLPWRAPTLAVASFAVAAAVMFAWRLSHAPAVSRAAAPVALRTYHATVHPLPGALLNLEGTNADDIVRLHDGEASFDVTPLRAGERFRVVAGNGEVEVRGTSFHVVVRGDRLAGVHVDHGRVEVRVAGRRTVALLAGDRWASDARATAETPSAAETAFVDGWSAFRAGQMRDAIDAFDEVVRLDPAGPLAEDARYWRAVARERIESAPKANGLR
jgi:hypothetical protein